MMRYLGGKTRIGKKIVVAMLRQGIDTSIYVDPFCGGLSSAAAAAPHFDHLILSDANEALITLYEAWIDGWRPERIDEEEYRLLRACANPTNPMTAFAGFGLSFAGKWFGGWARDNTGRDYFKNATNSLTQKMKALEGKAEFYYRPYVEAPDIGVIYCDPPYTNTTKYGAVGDFDSSAFWQWAEGLNSQVFVSEYSAPEKWTTIWECEHAVTTDTTSNNYKTSIERLFMRSE